MAEEPDGLGEFGQQLATLLIDALLEPGRLAMQIPDRAIADGVEFLTNTLAVAGITEENEAVVKYTIAQFEKVRAYRDELLAMRAEILPILTKKAAEIMAEEAGRKV